MKKSIVEVVFIISLFCLRGFAGEPALVWHKFDEGMERAKNENKQILIDVYTDWCGWCKTMDAKTYTDEKIVQYLSARYVRIRLNPETDGPITYRGKKIEASDFVRGMGVNGYPSTAFFESDASMITLVPGFIAADEFLPILQYIAEKKYTEMSFDDFLKKQNKN